MDLAHEIQQLAELRARGELSDEEVSRAKERLLAYGIGIRPAGLRRQSPWRVFGLPLWSIALGPDPERGESRGHARGIFALGDQATGVFALGGWARGVVAVGGLATGAIALGGCAVGLLLG